MTKLATGIQKILSSRAFYIGVLIFFIVEASWIAITARYPMAFDENYHFGLIQLYAKQFSPFIHHQPAGADVFGDVTRYPSYLYHYLMSFPYRLIVHLTANVADQIVALRFINIALCTAGLMLWKQVFRAVKVGEAVSNFILLVLVFLPQLPFLAAQNNYDNLLIPLVALSLWLTIEVTRQIKANALNPLLAGWLIVVCLLASLVQFTFLPIFFAILLVTTWQQRKLGRRRLATIPVSLTVKIICGVVLILGLSLFVERYGYNLIRYHSPTPDCAKILSVDDCLQYGPWARNFQYIAERTDDFGANPLTFTGVWLYRMAEQPFFVLRQDFLVSGVLWLPYLTAMIVFAIGLVTLLWRWRAIKTEPFARLALTVILIYVAALWLRNFSEYRHYQQYVAIQARYLFPILPLLFFLLLRAWQQLLPRRIHSLAALVIFILLIQGGAFTYIARTDRSWWWPQPTIIKLNQATQQIIRPFLARQPY